jgi:hypothetical protein
VLLRPGSFGAHAHHTHNERTGACARLPSHCQFAFSEARTRAHVGLNDVAGVGVKNRVLDTGRVNLYLCV